MNLEIWTAFVITNILICISPGPNMLLMLASGANHGFKKTSLTMLGCLLAVNIIMFLVAIGAGAVLVASPVAFNILRILGAGYLFYIGIRSILSTANITSPIIASKSLTRKKDFFFKGFLTGITNPKAILFDLSFIPQFIDSNKPLALQLVVILTTFAVIEFACYCLYALGGKSLSQFMKNRRNQRIFNIVIGLIFISFGITLLFSKLI